MTKDELIVKQQLEIEEFKKSREHNKEILKELHMKFYAIGAPLNDNILQFNRKQQLWCCDVINLIKSIK
jgi:hypothetical protein